MSAANLLDRLEGVRETGPDRWLARCPAHDDGSPSLSIRDAGDRLLIYCFAGCDPLSIVHALGLELSDLFDKPLTTAAPTSKRIRRHPRIPPRDILDAIDVEALVVAVIAADVVEHKSITPAQWERLGTAAARIGAARDLCR